MLQKRLGRTRVNKSIYEDDSARQSVILSSPYLACRDTSIKNMVRFDQNIQFDLNLVKTWIRPMSLRLILDLLTLIQIEHSGQSCNKHRKHGSESVRETESFDSFFVLEMTDSGLKCVTSVPVCHLTDKKCVKWLSFAYWLTLMFSVNILNDSISKC